MKAAGLILAVAVAAAGCTDTLPGVEGTQSLLVDLIGPADPGTPDAPLPAGAITVTVQVTALDEQGETDTSFAGDVDVYVQFLGSLTPELGGAPLARIALAGGQSAGSVDVALPSVFGPAFLWVEDGSRDGATYATGTSPTLWFSDPHLEDISRPDDEAALDALSSSPLEEKQLNVSGSRHATGGKLVVTGVYAQGYTVSDVQCADDAGTPPCVTGDYDHVLVFTFSRPRDERGDDLVVGQFINGFAGAVQEFNGLTEISFPQTFTDEGSAADADPAHVPVPDVVQESWLTDIIEFERRESTLIAVEGATLCELDEDYADYKQWKLDVGRGCGSPINVITAGVAEFDPTGYVGMTIPRVVGTLQPVNIGSFNVWIIKPRSDDDIVAP